MTSKDWRCHVSVCDEVAAAMRLSPEDTARMPKSWKFCLEHLSLIEDIAGLQRRVEVQRRKHPAYGDEPAYTCYGDAGKCPNIGALYPGGPYCEDHKPQQPRS